MDYTGINMVPGQPGTEFFTTHKQIWWGREEQQIYTGANLDSTAVDSGHTSYTDILRPGLALGQLTASKQLVHWNPYATDGSQKLVGFMDYEQKMEYLGVATDRFIGKVLLGGNVKAAALLIPGETDYGISGKDFEFLLREQCAGRFLLDDYFTAPYTSFDRIPTAAEITGGAITLTTADNKARVFNTGATGTITYTLPAPKPGLEFEFVPIANQDMVLDGPATGEFYVAGAAANTITINDFTASSVTNVVRVRAERTAADTYKYIPRPDAT